MVKASVAMIIAVRVVIAEGIGLAAEAIGAIVAIAIAVVIGIIDGDAAIAATLLEKKLMAKD